MRRAVNQALIKRLLASGGEGAASAEVSSAARYAASELQASSGQRTASKRWFSQSRASQSTATESVTSAPPYAIYGAAGAAGLGAVAYFALRQSPGGATAPPTSPKTNSPAPEAEGHQIGAFHVMDHMGMHFTQDDLLGDFAVIYFGKIDDPGRKGRLLQMADAVMESDRKSNMHYLTPIFATLAPKDDDVIKMNAMVEDYASALNRKSILHVRLKGISGDDNLKLHQRAQDYTIMVKGKEGTGANLATDTKNDTGYLYFVNPEGQFIATYGPDASPKDIASEWAEIMKAYKLSHPLWHGPKAVKARHA